MSVSAYPPKRLSEAVSNPVAVCPSTLVSAITRVRVLCLPHTAPLSGPPQQHAILICPHLWSHRLICLVYLSSPTPAPGSLTGLALILPLIPGEISLLGHSPHTQMFTGHFMEKFCSRFSVSSGRGVHFFFFCHQTFILFFDHHWELFLHLLICSN